MESRKKETGRKFIGIQFDCCNVYQRIYINKAGDGYWGACPKCGKQVKFAIGKGGVDSRFFSSK